MAYKKKTNKRAEKLVKSLLGKGKKDVGKKTIKKMAINAGYSEKYADKGKVLKSKTAQELIAKYLSDNVVYKTHGELLRSSEISHFIFPKVGKKNPISDDKIKEIIESVPGCRLLYIRPENYVGKIAFFQAPDAKSRKDALDMAYKIKGAYAPDKIELTKRKYQDLSNAELAALEKKLKNFLLKKD